MKKIILGIALTAAFATPLAAKNKPPVFVETAVVKDKPTVTLNPARAYIMLRSDLASPLLIMKMPSAEDQVAYDKLRADALIEAHKKYSKKFANYQRDKALAANNKEMRVPEMPVEPTEANFEFTPFGMMASVGIGPMNRFAKGKGNSTYLQEITPGSYRVYGMLAVTPGAAPTGSCFCMGSVRFDAKAGEITDLGVIMVTAGAPVAKVAGDSSAPIDLRGGKILQPAPADMAIDPRIASLTITPAHYKPVGKLPNYFGVAIGRIPEISGVLRYERDRIIDETAAQ